MRSTVFRSPTRANARARYVSSSRRDASIASLAKATTPAGLHRLRGRGAPATYETRAARDNASMCEIYSVAYKKSFVWKWRNTGKDGRVTESNVAYPLYYDCVCAARESGYLPTLGLA